MPAAGVSTSPGASAEEGADGARADGERMALLLERASRELPNKDLAALRSHEEAVGRREAALQRRREIVSAWRARRRGEAEAAKAKAEAEAAAAAAARERRGTHRVLARALAVLGPVRAVDPLVIAVATEDQGDPTGRKEEVQAGELR